MEKFINKANEEILQTLERRHKLDIAKITFTISLLGLGSFNINQNPPLISALFLAPLVALSFDLFIMRELHSLRRIGDFIANAKNNNIQQQDISDVDIKFEKEIKKKRNRYHRIGFTLLTLIVWLAAFSLYIYSRNYNSYILDDHIAISIFRKIFWFIVTIHFSFMALTIYKYDYPYRFSKDNIIGIVIEVVIFLSSFHLSFYFSNRIFLYSQIDRIVFHHKNNVIQLINNINKKDNKYKHQLDIALMNRITKRALEELEGLQGLRGLQGLPEELKRKIKEIDCKRYVNCSQYGMNTNKLKKIQNKLKKIQNFKNPRDHTLEKIENYRIILNKKRQIILFLSNTKLISVMNLTYVNLNNVDLSGINFTNNVENYGVDFRGADFRGVDFRGANLKKANLGGADLRRADLRRAYIKRADLRGADLREANLKRADLRGADLRGAYIKRADLRGADLRGAKGLTKSQIESTYYSEETYFDSKFEKKPNNVKFDRIKKGYE